MKSGLFDFLNPDMPIPSKYSQKVDGLQYIIIYKKLIILNLSKY